MRGPGGWREIAASSVNPFPQADVTTGVLYGCAVRLPNRPIPEIGIGGSPTRWPLEGRASARRPGLAGPGAPAQRRAPTRLPHRGSSSARRGEDRLGLEEDPRDARGHEAREAAGEDREQAEARDLRAAGGGEAADAAEQDGEGAEVGEAAEGVGGDHGGALGEGALLDQGAEL